MIAHDLGTVRLLVPHDRYEIVARLHALGHVQEQEHKEEGVLVTGRFPPSQAGIFGPYVLKDPAPRRKKRVRA
jgi:GTP-binding protein HflX